MDVKGVNPALGTAWLSATMRALAVFGLLLVGACSIEHELTPLQSAATRCKPSNVAYGKYPCLAVKDAPDEPMYCYRTIGGVECYAQPKPDLSAETRRQTYPPLVTDPPPYRPR
jgi:hypothetical protein